MTAVPPGGGISASDSRLTNTRASWEENLRWGAPSASQPVRATLPRSSMTGDGAAVGSGIMWLTGMPLRAGDVISKLACMSGATAGATLAHTWAALYTPGGAALAVQSPDSAAASWVANTWQEFVLGAPYTAPSDGLYLAAIMVAGTTPPSLRGVSLNQNGVASPSGLSIAIPTLSATAGSALTTTAPAGPLALATLSRMVQVLGY